MGTTNDPASKISDTKPNADSFQNYESKFGVRHVQIMFLLMVELLTYAMRSCMSVAIVSMEQVFNWDSNKRSLILSSVLWGTAVAQIPFGFLVMRCNAQKLLCACFLVSGMSLLSTPSFAEHLGWLAVLSSMSVVGFGLACVEPCVQNILSSWAPLPERARLTSTVLSAGNLGTIFSMTVSGFLAGSRFGWPSIFYTYGAIAITWSVVFYFFGWSSPAKHPKITFNEMTYIESSLNLARKTREGKKLKFPWRAVVKSLPAWSFVLCFCGQNWNLYFFSSNLPSYMNHILHFDIKNSGWISSLPYMLKWLMTLFIGWGMDYALSHGLSITVGRKIANTIGMWIPAAALVLMCIFDIPNKIVTVAILMVIVGMNGGTICGIGLGALDMCPNYSGTLFSIGSTCGKIFGIISQLVCGLIVTNQNDINQWRIVLYISAAMYFFPNLLYIILGSAKRQKWNEPNYLQDKKIALTTIISKDCPEEKVKLKCSNNCEYEA